MRQLDVIKNLGDALKKCAGMICTRYNGKIYDSLKIERIAIYNESKECLICLDLNAEFASKPIVKPYGDGHDAELQLFLKDTDSKREDP